MMHKKEVLQYLKEYRGAIGVHSKVPVKDESVLSLIYTPGVAEPCLEIARDGNMSFDYTCRGNTVAVVTDGSAVLGLGNKGPEAALPVMEGKSVIFKTFAGVDAFPVCIDTNNADRIVQTVNFLAPTFGAICLEDISSPRCFAIEEQLKRSTGIPVYHNDQHSAAIEVLAGLINASKVVGKNLKTMNIVINGAGAAGIAAAKTLYTAGITNIVLCDTSGAIYKYRMENMNWAKSEIARMTNKDNKKGKLQDIIKGADAFIGLSVGGVLDAEMIATMSRDPIVFALSVPQPEIMPDEAKSAGAKIVATGRADFPNEINIALVFPGIFRGMLDVSARNINCEMKLAAAHALANLVPEKKLDPEFIIPGVFDFQIAPEVASAVAESAINTGEARKSMSPDEVYERTQKYVNEGHFPYRKKKRLDQGTLKEKSLEIHHRYQGIIEIIPKLPIKDPEMFSALYLPPEAAKATQEILKDGMKIYDYTCKNNLVAIVSDGSAVLGLGNIGPRAAMPVMEGKAVLFHTLAGVEAFPICIATQDPDEIADIVKSISTTFGGINLEDISAPRCFMIEERLKNEMPIPVFHDDQHGTAVVVLAGLINSLKLVNKNIKDVKITINGAGASATGVTRLLIAYGIKNITMCDSCGIIYEGRQERMNPFKEEISKLTNPYKNKGKLLDAIKGCDVFVGLSVGGVVNREMIKSMAEDPIVFALANPAPEIMPDEAKSAGAKIVATGRSDFSNQVNNSLVFPGIFRGALDVRAKNITDTMKIAAAHALAGAVSERELGCDYIIPKGLDFRVPPIMSAAVAKAAIDTGESRVSADPEKIAEHTRSFIYEGELGLI